LSAACDETAVANIIDRGGGSIIRDGSTGSAIYGAACVVKNSIYYALIVDGDICSTNNEAAIAYCAYAVRYRDGKDVAANSSSEVIREYADVFSVNPNKATTYSSCITEAHYTVNLNWYKTTVDKGARQIAKTAHITGSIDALSGSGNSSAVG